MSSADVPRLISAANLPDGPDSVTAWIKLGLPTRRIVGRRLEHGPSPETDRAIDELRAMQEEAARRLVNWWRVTTR